MDHTSEKITIQGQIKAAKASILDTKPTILKIIIYILMTILCIFLGIVKIRIMAAIVFKNIALIVIGILLFFIGKQLGTRGYPKLAIIITTTLALLFCGCEVVIVAKLIIKYPLYCVLLVLLKLMISNETLTVDGVVSISSEKDGFSCSVIDKNENMKIIYVQTKPKTRLLITEEDELCVINVIDPLNSFNVQARKIVPLTEIQIRVNKSEVDMSKLLADIETKIGVEVIEA